MSVVRETLLQEIRDAQKKSVAYAREKNTALTDFKKQYFMKKLIKNNRKVLELLESLERLPPDKKNNKDEQPTISEPK